MATTLTADQLNQIAKQSGYQGGTFSSTGLSSTPTLPAPTSQPTSQPTSSAMPGSYQAIQQQSSQPSMAYGAVNTPNTAPNNATTNPPNQDAYFQKMANANPEAADAAMTKAGYGPAQADPNITQAYQLGTYDQRSKLAQQYGIQNYTGTADQNTQLLNKYRSGFQQAQQSGVQSPTTQGQGSAMVNSFTGGQTQIPSVNPIDSILQQDQGYQKLLADYKAFTDSNAQRESLVDQYSRLQKESGLPEINAELINDKKIIDGTEQDIRNEVSAAGGMATESQVQALAGARNKTLISNYNALLATRDNALSNINTMLGLSQQDREYAQQQFNNQIDFDRQMISYGEKFQNNAKESYNAIIGQVGYSGLYQAVQNDPYSVSLIEQTLGLPNGGLAQLAQQQTFDQQAESRLQAKASGVSTGGGASSTALSPISQSVITNPSLFYDFTPTQKAQVVSELQANGYDISNLQNAKLSASQQDELSQMNTVSSLIDKVLLYNSDGNLEGIGAFGQGTLKSTLAQFGLGGKEGQDVRALLGNIKGTIAKLRGGTSFTPNEEKLLDSYTPSINDSSSVAINKLHLLQDFIAQKNTDLVKASQANITKGQVTKPSDSGIEDIKKKYNLNY